MSASIRFTLCLLFSAMFISGCSGSSDSQSLEVTENATAENSSVSAEDGTFDGGVVDDDSAGAADATSIATNEPVDSTSNTGESMSINSDPVTPDPVTQNRTQVDFEITVPVYQSNALQVRLIWGDSEMSAIWVGDELWSASTELPTDTEYLLTITFYDNNGDIELASYEQLYRTGSNAAESLQVNADQFDSLKWDADEDGISNLYELASGTDPFVNESLSLEIRDSFYLGNSVFFAERFTIRIPAERPYNFLSEVSEISDDCTSDEHCAHLSRNIQNITIDVDADGNGSVYDFHETGSRRYPNNVRFQATRTISESSIDWEGSRYYFDEASDGWVDATYFSNVVAAVDATTRSYIGKTNQSSGADYPQGAFSSEHNLIGRKMEDSTLCEPIAGSLVKKTYYESEHILTTTIAKQVDEAYWKVSELNINDSDMSKEYFVRSLGVEPTFNCDLTDLQ